MQFPLTGLFQPQRLPADAPKNPREISSQNETDRAAVRILLSGGALNLAGPRR
jgi:hypothetical protein